MQALQRTLYAGTMRATGFIQRQMECNKALTALCTVAAAIFVVAVNRGSNRPQQEGSTAMWLAVAAFVTVSIAAGQALFNRLQNAAALLLLPPAFVERT